MARQLGTHEDLKEQTATENKEVVAGNTTSAGEDGLYHPGIWSIREAFGLQVHHIAYINIIQVHRK